MAFFNVNNTGDASMFDDARHQGQINILFADGHGAGEVLPHKSARYSPTGPPSTVVLVGPEEGAILLVHEKPIMNLQ